MAGVTVAASSLSWIVPVSTVVSALRIEIWIGELELTFAAPDAGETDAIKGGCVPVTGTKTR